MLVTEVATFKSRKVQFTGTRVQAGPCVFAYLLHSEDLEKALCTRLSREKKGQDPVYTTRAYL